MEELLEFILLFFFLEFIILFQTRILRIAIVTGVYLHALVLLHMKFFIAGNILDGLFYRHIINHI